MARSFRLAFAAKRFATRDVRQLSRYRADWEAPAPAGLSPPPRWPIIAEGGAPQVCVGLLRRPPQHLPDDVLRTPQLLLFEHQR